MSCADLSTGAPGEQVPSKTAATEAYEKRQAQYAREEQERASRKEAERLQKQEKLLWEKAERERAKKGGKAVPKTKRPPFNFEAVSHLG